ncbi:MAG: hypothetical protein M3430_07475 [Acidobacteriota bacterium]|nr:hypothetical protein [Acidobacteriota bacterium]
MFRRSINKLSSGAFLEGQLQRELPTARFRGGARNLSESGVRRVGIRRIEVGLVPGVENFGAELCLHSFADWKTLGERKVPADLFITANAAEAQRAFSASMLSIFSLRTAT